MATALAAPQPRYPMSLNLPPEFERAVRERVESGAYASADAVFRACLEALAVWEDVQRAKFEKLRGEIQVGIDQADRGPVVDGEEALQRIRARLMEKAGALETVGKLQQDFTALGAEVDAELARIAQGEVIDRDAVLNRMRVLYGDNPPPNDEFFRRMNAWRIAERVAAGTYDSAGDVIHSALCWLEEGEAADAADDELRREIEEAIGELDRGEGIPGDVVFARIQEELRRVTAR
jgi:antitoxin ParD1/3/4